MDENNRKIEEAQRKLVGLSSKCLPVCADVCCWRMCDVMVA